MNKYNTTVEKIQEEELPENLEWKYSRAVHQGNIIDITRLSFLPKNHIKKISKNEYVDIRTGEVKNVSPKSESGEQIRNKRSLRKIFKDLRQLINTNFDGGSNQLFLTLTYAENMTDDKKLYSDFDKFWKKLKYNYKEKGLEYITIIEPQGRGAWHAHILLKSMKSDDLYIPDETIRKMWEHGITKTERLGNVDNLGSYFIAYFSNVEITEENKQHYELSNSDIIEKNGKRIIKGERLDYYPDYMKIYRASRGIIKPIILEDVETKDYKKTYDAITHIDNNGAEMYIKTEQYKKNK